MVKNMQGLDKEDIHGFFEALDKEIENDLEQPSAKFTLIAVGGTSLVLRKMKPSTKDIDFMVDDISLEKARGYMKKAQEKGRLKVDVWQFPNIFSTTLPDDTSSDIYPKKYRHFDVRLINMVDNAAAKLSRFNEPDREDIDAIIKSGVSPEKIADRFKTILKNNGFANKDDAKNKLEIFKGIYLS